MTSIEFLRQYKIGPFAIFDTAGSYLLVLILSPFLSKLFAKFGLNIPVSSWLWLTLPISVIFHIVFHQSTSLMKILTNPKQIDFYIAFAILLFMAYMGLKNIHRITV